MGDQGKSYRDVVDRRRFIQLIGAAGAVSLAGCTGGDGGDGGSDGGTSQHISRCNKVPKSLQWNPDNAEGSAQISQFALFDAFAKFNFAKDKLEPYAITEWTHGDKSLELKLRDGLTWANGDKVTSGDIATQLRLGTYTGAPYASYTKSIETPDEKTTVMNFGAKVNPKVIELNVLPNNLVQQKESVFGKYVKQLEKDKKKGQRALTSFAWKEPIASGPFTFESADQKQLVLKTRDDHPDSKNINFDEYVFRYIEGNPATHQALINMNVDSVFSVFTPPEIVNMLPKQIKQVQTSGNWGLGLVPNHSHKHAGDRAVRQAIQHIINREQIIKNVGKTTKTTPKIPTGIVTRNQKKWLGKAMSDFDTYGKSSSQTEKATKVLKKAGYSKKDGTWTDSDGKTVTLPIIGPSGWSDWITSLKSIVDQFKIFGFETSLTTRKFATLNDTVWPKGNFTLAAGPWLPGGASGAYPYSSLHHQLVKVGWGTFKYNYPAAVQESGGSRKDITVPSRTGSGKLTVNPYKKMGEFAKTNEESKLKDLIIEQAWVANQDLPMIAVQEKYEQTFITDGEDWDIPKPDADAAQVQWANTWLPRMGKMKYNGN
jgi:peptide/nickel transport system substrate-binding protein